MITLKNNIFSNYANFKNNTNDYIALRITNNYIYAYVISKFVDKYKDENDNEETYIKINSIDRINYLRFKNFINPIRNREKYKERINILFIFEYNEFLNIIKNGYDININAEQNILLYGENKKDGVNFK